MCPTNCDSIIIEKDIVSSVYPTDNELNKLLEKNNYLESMMHKMDRNELKSAILHLQINFDRLEFEQITEIPKVNLIDLISSIGGTLGLFLGMSFLSILEVTDLFFVMIRYLREKS